MKNAVTHCITQTARAQVWQLIINETQKRIRLRCEPTNWKISIETQQHTACNDEFVCACNRKKLFICFVWMGTIKNCYVVLRPATKRPYAVRTQFTSGSRGGAPGAPPPPNGRGPMIFYAQIAQFSLYFSTLASLAIHFKHNFNRNMARTR